MGGDAGRDRFSAVLERLRGQRPKPGCETELLPDGEMHPYSQKHGDGNQRDLKKFPIATCFRATGSNFLTSILSGIFFLFLVAI